VAGYVIRGGEAGKTWLSVVGCDDTTGIAGCAEPDTIPAFPRIFPVFGRRPG
jgi:hypothetical protein